jgi:hypothetical protein
MEHNGIISFGEFWVSYSVWVHLDKEISFVGCVDGELLKYWRLMMNCEGNHFSDSFVTLVGLGNLNLNYDREG